MIRSLRRIMPEEIPSSVAKTYATGAGKRYMPQYQLMAQEIASVAHGTLLDVGTGPGLLPLEIARIDPSLQIIGIDISEAMIAIAGKKAEDSGLKNVSFRSMNANGLSFADNSLDMIISTDALHHWKTPTLVLNEMYRCLKPGAEAWVYDGYPDASDQEISSYINGAGSLFLPYWLLRLNLLIHGFSKKEYDTVVKQMVAQTRFGSGVFEQRGVMMRLKLIKDSSSG